LGQYLCEKEHHILTWYAPFACDQTAINAFIGQSHGLYGLVLFINKEKKATDDQVFYGWHLAFANCQAMKSQNRHCKVIEGH